MRDHEDLPYIVIERHSSGVTPFLWGALLGVGAALLFAPRSGEETQEEIRQGVRRVRLAAGGRVNDMRDAVTGRVTRTRDRIQDQLDSVRETVEARTERARHAMDAGRRAAQEARSQLERRVAQAKESLNTFQEQGQDQGRYSGGASRQPPGGEVVVTDVIVEEGEERPDLG